MTSRRSFLSRLGVAIGIGTGAGAAVPSLFETCNENMARSRYFSRLMASQADNLTQIWATRFDDFLGKRVELFDVSDDHPLRYVYDERTETFCRVKDYPPISGYIVTCDMVKHSFPV